jgi:hypothetical protein
MIQIGQRKTLVNRNRFGWLKKRKLVNRRILISKYSLIKATLLDENGSIQAITQLRGFRTKEQIINRLISRAKSDGTKKGKVFITDITRGKVFEQKVKF